MTFDEWDKANSLEYKGYVIHPGTIHKGADVMWIFVTSLSASKEEIFKQGQQIIDEWNRDERLKAHSSTP